MVRLQTLPIVLMMSSSADNAANNTASPLLASQRTPSSHPHPLQREGTFRIENLTPEEVALEDAMNQSSPPPSVLRKQAHDDEGEVGDTETEVLLIYYWNLLLDFPLHLL